MENPGNQSEEATGAVEDPPPPTISAQEQSTSESSSQQQQQERRPPPPLSPLTGSYLLIVVGEPHSERHKEIILQKIAKAFLSWDVSECHVSLEKELQIIVGQSPEGEEARYGERLIQYATENLVTEILIHPQLNTLHQCLKNLLSSFTKHRHIIHAGYTFAGNGSWILQDGTLSISDLVESLHEPDVLRVLKAYENSVSIDVHCAPEGDWTTERFHKEPVSKLCNIRINPGDVMTAGNPVISAFIDYLSPFLEPANIQQLLQPTDVVGNIRFTHPTLYVFPGGQGDAALFGINGFNMLIDGGFARKACFWDFARHLDRLDAVLLTRLNNSTVNGISAVLQRKKMNHVYPQIGHFFCNLQDRKIALSPDGDKDKDSLIVSLAVEGQEIVANLRHLALKPHPCYRDGNQVDPVNLYHKVGHGKLDMYVISPARDSQAVKEFLAKWSSNDSHLFSNTGRKTPGKAFEFPLQNLVSICALLVWQPANPNDTITRILFPGSTPQHKIFEGLEKLRHLEFLKHPVCSAKSISPSASTATVTRSLSKTRQPKPPEFRQKETKTVSKPQVKPSKPKTEKTPPKEIKSKLDNKLEDEKNEVENVEEPLKKLDNRLISKDEQIENIKKEIQKIEQAENEEQKKKIIHRSKYDMRNVKSKVDSRAPSKSIDRKKVQEKKPDGEASPPGTPKKGLANGAATKAEKVKVAAKSTKAPSPSSTPAKSAKEANNRKVVEARVTTRSVSKSAVRKKEETPPPPSAPAKTEKKPIGRRPKAPASPVKSSNGKPGKMEPDSVPKKIKKKTDVDATAVKAISRTIKRGGEKGAETEKTEIEEGEEKEKDIKKVSEETTENKETDTKAVRNEMESAQFEEREKEPEEEEDEEEEEEEEYLIVTKEEYGEESAKEDESGKENEEEVQTKDETEGEGEMKKLLREEEESEKKRETPEKREEKVENEAEKLEETEKDRGDTEVKIGDTNRVGEKDARRPESPEQKTPEGRESELQRLMEVDEGIDLKEPVSKEHKEGESLPEEKMSNTLETSATTAPTLPEDERVEEPVEVQKEQQPEEVKEVIEEKYIQEKTKEEKKEVEEEVQKEVEPQQPIAPTTIDVEGTPLHAQTAQRRRPRDVVKTPDEVAELPVHEEVDPRMYSSGEFTKDLQRKSEDEKTEKPDFKAMIKGEANFLDEEASEESEESKKKSKEIQHKEKDEVEDPVITKYLNIIDELEKSATEIKPEAKPDEKEKEAEVQEESATEAKEAKAITEAEADEVKPEDDEKRPSLQVEDVGTGQISGRSTPRVVEKVASGKSSPEDLGRGVSGKSTPVGPPKESSGKSSPQDFIPSGKSTPHDLEKPKDSPRTSTPLDIYRETSGKSTPLERERDISGKATPQDLNKISGKSSPQDLQKRTSVEFLSQDIANELSEKPSDAELSRQQTPHDLEKEASGKSTPVSKPSSEVSRGPTPHELGKQLSGKSTPDYKLSTELSRESTPLDLRKETSGKSTPESISNAEASTRHTPLDIRKEISGKSVPHSKEEPEVSRVPTPHDLEKETAVQSSAKESPEHFAEDTLEELEKKTPGKKENSGEPIPEDLEKPTSGKSSPDKLLKDVSGKSTPQKPEEKTSGRSSPKVQEREEPSLVPERKESPEEGKVDERSTAVDLGWDISGKSTPQDARVSEDSSLKGTEHLREATGKSPVSKEATPQDLLKDVSEKLPPFTNEITEKTAKETSGKSTPDDLNNEISRISTPNAQEKEPSGKSTPQELSKEVSGKSTPFDLDISGKSTPQDLKKVPGEDRTLQMEVPGLFKENISGKSTPQEVEKPIPEKTSSETLRKEASQGSSPIQQEKLSSRRSTPEDLSKDISGKTTLGKDEEIPAQLTQGSSRRSSPQELEKEIPEKLPQADAGEEILGKTTPHDVSRKVSQTLSGKVTPCDEEKSISAKTSRRESETSLAPSPLQDGISTQVISQSLLDGISPVADQEVLSKVEVNPTKTESLHFVEKAEVEKEGKISSEVKPSSGTATPMDKALLRKEISESQEKIVKKGVESSVSDSMSSGLGEKDISGKSTPFSTDKEISGKISPSAGGKVTSDSVSLALAEKGTYSLEKESSEKISSPSPVDISPLSLDDLKEEKGDKEKEVTAEPDLFKPSVPRKSVTDSHIPGKSPLDQVKYECASSGTSTPDRSHYEKSDASFQNGVESEDEPEKGILESERQEKESQILDLSSGEEEELKALGVDEDSETEMRKDELEGGSIAKEIAKVEKDDINKLVKIGSGTEAEAEEDQHQNTCVKRMLVTASSEDGGTETEICLKDGIKITKEERTEKDEKEDEEEEEQEEGEGEFSNLILQARREYNAQRSRKTSYNSSEDVEEDEEIGKDEEAAEDEEEELGTLLQQARRELEFVRSQKRGQQGDTTFERTLETKKTTTRSETTRMEDDDIITITTILTQEREEQEDGSVKVTTTKETTTKGGKNEGTVVSVNTNIEKRQQPQREEEILGQVSSSRDGKSGGRHSREEGETKTSQEEPMETSRRTSASSIISQEDLVSRKDSTKIEDFRQSSTEMSPLKTTYITSHGDSESLMTSSFYGNLPTEDEMIGRSEHLKEFRRGRGYESFMEVGPNGERTERTYFYGSDDDPGAVRDRSRFVKAYYTEEGQRKEGEQSRFVHRYYPSDVAEGETVEKTRFVQTFYTEGGSQPDADSKIRFVETLAEESTEHLDFAKAIDEHVLARGEHLKREMKEEAGKYVNGKSKDGKDEAGNSGGSAAEEDKKDVIEGWGKPLGLPLPPKNMNKHYGFPGQNISTTSTLSTPTDNSDSVSNWGHPMNLPSPAPPPSVNGTVETLLGKSASPARETPDKEKKIQLKKNVLGDNKSSGTNTPNRRSESPVKQFERRTPSTGRNKSGSNSYVYLDLTYVPHHGNSYYSNVEFFKKVRARYYVFSGTEPSKEVYNALLEAKQTWEDKKLEVTIIPTYDTDVLGYWVAENEEILAKHKIDLSPSASRCTINLQDHETSCSAYRLEF